MCGVADGICPGFAVKPVLVAAAYCSVSVRDTFSRVPSASHACRKNAVSPGTLTSHAPAMVALFWNPVTCKPALTVAAGKPVYVTACPAAAPESAASKAHVEVLLTGNVPLMYTVTGPDAAAVRAAACAAASDFSGADADAPVLLSLPFWALTYTAAPETEAEAAAAATQRHSAAATAAKRRVHRMGTNPKVGRNVWVFCILTSPILLNAQ